MSKAHLHQLHWSRFPKLSCHHQKPNRLPPPHHLFALLTINHYHEYHLREWINHIRFQYLVYEGFNSTMDVVVKLKGLTKYSSVVAFICSKGYFWDIFLHNLVISKFQIQFGDIIAPPNSCSTSSIMSRKFIWNLVNFFKAQISTQPPSSNLLFDRYNRTGTWGYL